MPTAKLGPLTQHVPGVPTRPEDPLIQRRALPTHHALPIFSLSFLLSAASLRRLRSHELSPDPPFSPGALYSVQSERNDAAVPNASRTDPAACGRGGEARRDLSTSFSKIRGQGRFLSLVMGSNWMTIFLAWFSLFRFSSRFPGGGSSPLCFLVPRRQSRCSPSPLDHMPSRLVWYKAKPGSVCWLRSSLAPFLFLYGKSHTGRCRVFFI